MFFPKKEPSNPWRMQAWFLNYPIFNIENISFEDLIPLNGYDISLKKTFDKSEHVDWFMDKSDLFLKRKLKWYAWKFKTYVISSLSSTNKFSWWYKNCQWIIWIWQMGCGNVSFMSHQCPSEILREDKYWKLELNKLWEDFKSDLIQRLRRLKSQATNLDIVLFGWNIFDVSDKTNYTGSKNHLYYYKESLKLYVRLIIEETWIIPTVIVWPNKFSWSQAFLLDTSNRRLYCTRFDGSINRTNEWLILTNDWDNEIEIYIDLLCWRISYQDYHAFMYSREIFKWFKELTKEDIQSSIFSIIKSAHFNGLDNNEIDWLIASLNLGGDFFKLYTPLQYKIPIAEYYEIILLLEKLWLERSYFVSLIKKKLINQK